MILFLTALLLLTIGALSLFIFPILPLRRGHGQSRTGKLVYICFVFFLFAVLVPALYGRQGKMLMPDYPLAGRDTLEAETQTRSMARVRRLERYLAANPDDGIVWEQLAQTYRSAGYYDEAATAYRNAIEWGIPQDISNWHALAETLIQANNGRITGEAQKALALWRYLEQILSAEDPWLTVIHERIAGLQETLRLDPRAVKPQAPVL